MVSAELAPLQPAAASLLECQNHYHPELADFPVTSFFWKRIYAELWLKRGVPRQGLEAAYLSNRWFQRKIVKTLESRRCRHLWEGPPGIFLSWSYIAKDVIPVFQRHGWKCVVMQLDGAFHEQSIVAAEVAAHPELSPGWRPAPPGYFEDWQEECNRADHLIANSRWGEQCLEQCGVVANKITVIPFAAENQPAAKAPRIYPRQFDASRPLRVLYVGQMVLRKGIAPLIGAIRALDSAPIQFDFAGAVGVEFPADILASPRVRMHGRVAREKIEALFRDADVFILPTLSDAFALTQLEAMGWKLPVIASRHCGEVVKHGLNGLILEEISARAIVEALSGLLRSPETLARMSQHCAVPPQCELSHFGRSLVALENILYPPAPRR